VLDFRYHALSLVAVFLALGIGIVLGSSLGDTVVSQANRDIANSLRGDLAHARRDASGAHAAVGQRERLLQAAFTRIADTKLAGRRVVLVSSGRLADAVRSGARDAVRGAGGKFGVVAQLQSPPDLAQLGAAVGSRFEKLRSDDTRLRPLGRRIGTALLAGGRLARRLHERFPERFGGRVAPGDGVVFYRDPAPDRTAAVKQFEQGLIDGLLGTGAPVVGVETTDTDPSQVPFYSNQGLSSVDDVDSAGGHIALVLTLAGAHGNFGYKKTADAPLPPVKGARAGG
jgi:Copper transport outer membrane protein, MctB